ncbi:hypothetical protein ZHAS_00002695 [Anopheles sinensis]|uniref:Uncharacterized protein n=1 Tax=Anopheles sinensis TaxID=74873 RepID=A0A084VCU5_ANOSI|nr:hypothetical protein ZHAS_00002695 [Anopheles sinensis]
MCVRRLVSFANAAVINRLQHRTRAAVVLGGNRSVPWLRAAPLGGAWELLDKAGVTENATGRTNQRPSTTTTTETTTTETMQKAIDRLSDTVFSLGEGEGQKQPTVYLPSNATCPQLRGRVRSTNVGMLHAMLFRLLLCIGWVSVLHHVRRVAKWRARVSRQCRSPSTDCSLAAESLNEHWLVALEGWEMPTQCTETNTERARLDVGG